MKALLIAIFRRLYMALPVPYSFKKRCRDGLVSRFSVIARLSQSARYRTGYSQAERSTAPAPHSDTVSDEGMAYPIKIRTDSMPHAAARSITYVPKPSTDFGSNPPLVRLMAFYLPQFHPIPENDAWWSKGFTEWTNVTRAKPQLEGQWQPHLPGELGFYDLRTEGVMERQAQLAAAHGVEGFCFYFYWFAGKRLLERPLLDFLANKEIKLSFSLCWANENWTRRWDGHDSDVLIGQDHSELDDIAFIEYVSKFMRDPRYVRIDGKPLLTVYRPSLLPDAAATAKRWRQRCRELGIGEIYLAFTLSFDAFEPASIGFDGAMEFPPNNTAPPNITNDVAKINPAFSGLVFDWRALVERSHAYKEPKYELFRGVCPSWDNEARKPGKGTLLMYSSPRRYEEWLENAARDSVARFRDVTKRIVLVNAWNEWAEGAHLEPDVRHGYAYLQATKRALQRAAEPVGSDVPNRVTVVIHAYYPELLPEILKELQKWDVPHRVIVTTVFQVETEVKAIIEQYAAGSLCLVFDNKGRDILPFLKVLDQLIAEREPLVLKLHTKKSLHREDGEAWRKDLLLKLISPAKAQEIFEAFRSEPALAVVAPSGHILSMDTYLGSNADSLAYLCRRMGVVAENPVAAAFAAGSMFYVRPKIFGPLLDIQLDESEFELEAGQTDGTIAHAIERVFGILAMQNGGILASSDEPSKAFIGFAKSYLYAQISKAEPSRNFEAI